MLSQADLDALREVTSLRASRPLFAWFARAGLAGHGVAGSLGGRPGTIADLAAAVIAVATVSVDAAEALVAHRLCIELLACANNVALRDYLLPQLLGGDKAGAWPAHAMRAMAQGRSPSATGADTGRGFRLTGILPDTANLCAEALVLPCPVAFGDAAETELILLSSEQDGLHADVASNAWVGTARLHQLFFREDELLGGNAIAMIRQVHPLARALSCASALGLAEACVALLPQGNATSDCHASVKLARRGLLSALNVASTWQSPVLLEQWEQKFLHQANTALVLADGHPGAPRLRVIATRRWAGSGRRPFASNRPVDEPGSP